MLESVYTLKPHQHTIVEDYIRDWKPIIEGFDQAAIDRLCNVIDSLKLQRALTERAEIDGLLQDHHRNADALMRRWARVSAGIDELTRRGVQP